MSKAIIVYQAKQEVIGKHIQSNQWVMYTGVLTIYERKVDPVVIKLKSEIWDSLLRGYMDDKKAFKGDSVSAVYGKISKWFYNNGIIFQI